MTDKEFYEYLKGNPTIIGIVSHMKTWWSNERTDKELQDLFDLIIKLDSSNRWIPVSERLPKERERVLICLDAPINQICISQRVDTNYWIGQGRVNVLAWQKLPKPYEVKEE